jgi:phenylacetic acid degradation operon negative regulatory protein
MTKPNSIRTQILIFTLFGEYIVPRGGTAWTAGLLKLMDVLGVSERAVRSTLSRMSQNGYLKSDRHGRYSRYKLTQHGKRVVEAGEVRIFEPRRKHWDGLWHMVVYSIPEDKRRVRALLRTRLGWLGFGYLAPGTWISPSERSDEVKADLKDVGADDYAVYFGGMKLFYDDDLELVDRCWNLNAINLDYASFLEKYETSYRAAMRSVERGNQIVPSESFRQRFFLTLDYSQFPRKDPNLPPALLPEEWLGTTANEVFLGFHDLLEDSSGKFVTEVLNSDPSRSGKELRNTESERRSK